MAGKRREKPEKIGKSVQFSEDDDDAATTTEVGSDRRTDLRMRARGTSRQQRTSSFWQNEQTLVSEGYVL